MNINSLPNQIYEDEEDLTILLGDLSLSSVSNSSHSSRSSTPSLPRNPSPIQISSNPLPTSKPNQFAYSRFCQAFVENGECNQDGCTYAHSLSQLNPVRCNFGERCRNLYNPRRECGFIHPQETKDQFIQRVKMVIPENIKMAEVLEHQKKVSQEQKRKKEIEMIYPIVTVYTTYSQLGKDLFILAKFNITDFQVKIISEEEMRPKMVWNLEENFFTRINKMIEDGNIDNEFTSTFYLQKSILIKKQDGSEDHLAGPIMATTLLDTFQNLKFKVDKIEDNFIYISLV